MTSVIKKLGLAVGVLLLAVLLLAAFVFARHYVYWSPAEEVAFASGPITLAGTFVKPADEGVFPALLLLHGSGPEPRADPTTRAVVNRLVRSGIATLVYDKRGVGSSAGDFESADYVDFIDDAMAAVEYLARRPDVDPARIGLYTVSESGWLGPEIAVRTGKVALMFNKVAPTLSFAETVIWEVRNDAIADGVTESDVEPLLELTMRRWRYYRDAAADPALAAGPEREAIEAELTALRASIPGADTVLPEELAPYDATRYAEIATRLFYDPWPYLLELDIPMYYAYGEKDINIPTRRCVEALEALIDEHGKDVEVIVYPGLGHGLATWRGALELGWAPGYLDRLAAWTVAKSGIDSQP